MNEQNKVTTTDSFVQQLRNLKQQQQYFEEKGEYSKADKVRRRLEKNSEYQEKVKGKVIREKHLSEKVMLVHAHTKQAIDFYAEWDKYFEEFDKQTQIYVKEMIDRHKEELERYQEQLQKEALSKPPRWSRELIQWRKRQHILADQRNYAQAQEMKFISDSLEEEERCSMNTNFSESCERKEANLRKRQELELKGLRNKLDTRRSIMEAQRKQDCNRLFKRNQYLQHDLEVKQVSIYLFDLVLSIILSCDIAQCNSYFNCRTKRCAKWLTLSVKYDWISLIIYSKACILVWRRIEFKTFTYSNHLVLW